MVMRNKTPVSATYHGYIASSRDALLVIDAVLRGLLLPVTNRPTPKERKALIRSGNVFVFIEEESNIKRWTDGTSWSPSRILGRFLIYRELSKNIVKDSNNNLSAITSVVEDNGDSNNMDNGNASGSRATSTATNNNNNNNNNSTNNNGANNHYASTESRFVKLNCQPITAYAMAGGEDVIRKRSIDDVIKEDANSNNNNNNNTDTNSTHNSIRGDTTISNTNEINTNLLNSNIEVDVLSDNIYRSDGLIKKSLSIVLHSPSRKTIHLVSYYTTKDVINNKLNIPSSDNFFKDNSVVPSYELIDSLLNTSLGHSISHRRRSDPSASHPGFDTLPLSHDFQQPQQTASVTQTHQYHQHHPQQQQQQQQQLATAAPPLSQQLDYPTSLRTLPVSQSSQMQQNDQLQFNASPLVNETDDVSNQNKHPQSTLESSNLLTLV
ncbi:White-opaque regulator 1 [Pichia kudriavzevii]|uniref:White-opaque regulator 1 n=1 Tax=Pichia kudriavzevii TaxID=4909 RepID=A0A1V2LT13_PICKU|nr:White-opaque regulator 1 [Pichia kudriavzevii]